MSTGKPVMPGRATRDLNNSDPGHNTDAITAVAGEQAALQDVERLLAELQDLPEHERQATPVLIGPSGHQIPITPSLYRAVLRAAHYLAHNQAVSVAAASKQLTTTQAAALPGVSRPYLTKLLDTGQLPGTRVGSKRRVALDDLLRYKHVHEGARRVALDRLIAMSGETDIDLDDVAYLYQRRRSNGQREEPGA